MSNDRRRISIYNFTALLILYVLMSAIVHLTIANTIPNFLAYSILIFPIHIIFCIVFVIGSVSTLPKRAIVQYSPKAIGQVFIAQSALLLMTPIDCGNFKSEISCLSLIESLIQSRFTIPYNHSYLFGGMVVVYVIATIFFFNQTEIIKPHRPMQD